MSKRYTLTTDEANALVALGSGSVVVFPQLVVGIRSVPSKSRRALDGLISKGLAVREQEEPGFGLTDEGRSAYRGLTDKSSYQSAHGGGHRDEVRVLAPEATPDDPDARVGSLDEHELDEAIDRELAKLSE